jgi:hypothetical protein
MNYYLASQLIADRDAALTADLANRTQVREARAARKARATSADRQTRTRRLFIRRPAPAAA